MEITERSRITNKGYSIKVWSYKKEDTPAVKRQPVYRFLRRTMDKEDTEKQKIKYFTELFVSNFFLLHQVRKVKLLTLPGITWDFERRLRKRFFKKRRNISVTGCEFDYKVFKLSAANMPGRKKDKLQSYYSDNLGHYVVTNTKDMVYLLNADIFDIINEKDNKGVHYDCIWLDTTNTVISITRKLNGIGNLLSENSIIILTVLKGREHIKFETNRTDFVSERLKEFGFKLIHQKEYFDTSPMLHLIYTRHSEPAAQESDTTNDK